MVIRLQLLGLQSLHQPSVLLVTQLPCLRTVSRPLEASLFQPLCHQHESAPLPIQPPDPVPPVAAEQEQRIAEPVQMKLPLHQCRQAVDLCTHRQCIPICSTKIAQHCLSSSTSILSISGPISWYRSMMPSPMLSVAVRSETFRTGCCTGSSTNAAPDRPASSFLRIPDNTSLSHR